MPIRHLSDAFHPQSPGPSWTPAHWFPCLPLVSLLRSLITGCLPMCAASCWRGGVLASTLVGFLGSALGPDPSMHHGARVPVASARCVRLPRSIPFCLLREHPWLPQSSGGATTRAGLAPRTACTCRMSLPCPCLSLPSTLLTFSLHHDAYFTPYMVAPRFSVQRTFGERRRNS